MKSLIYLIFLLYFVKGDDEKINLDSYKVYRVVPSNNNQSDFLYNLQNNIMELDFWSRVKKVGFPVDIMVSPDMQEDFVEMMKENNIQNTEMINNVQTLIDAEKIGSLGRSNEMTWDAYYNLSDIYKWMDHLAERYPRIVTLVYAGRTFQGRPMKGVKISFRPGKRNVFIEGGMHAREWIAPATVTYIINELLKSKNQTFREIAQSFDWHLFPVTNPDGYDYSHRRNRLWRKTRSTYNGVCWGVDANRNYDYHFAEEGGANDNPCDDKYHGPYPFSESETQGLSKYVKSIGSETDVYIPIHSFGQLLLIPYGNTPEHLDNFDDVYQIGLKMAEALARKYGTRYIVGNVYETIYQVSGDSADWAKYNFKIPITIGYELRDTGEYGMLLPVEQIIPNCEEVIDSLIALFIESEKYGYFQIDKTATK